MKYLFSVLLVLTGLPLLYAAELPNENDCFPFVISYDREENASNMSHLLAAPAGKDGFIRIENGRFVNNAGPVRLNATNLTGPANFPTHEESDKLARRLARFGFNCVRLHYFDSPYGTFLFPPLPSILKESPETQRLLDEKQRDRQDYLIAALKKQGIYINMNLHVARFWDERDGFTGRNGRPWADKGLDNFEPRMIELQKEYAKKLLTHVNPYTGLAYTDEPAIAVIEINNENGLTLTYRGGSIDRLPDPYQTELKNQWNAWLKKKYRTSEILKKSWIEEPIPLTNEQITEGKFDQKVSVDKKRWIIEREKTKVQFETNNGTLVLNVSDKSSELFPKIFRTISVKKDGIYTLSFRIKRTKATPDTKLGLAIADSVQGWRSLGVFEKINAGTEWTDYSITFRAIDDSPNAQFQLTRLNNGQYELDNLSFMSGRPEYKMELGSIEKGTVPTVKQSGNATQIQRRDFYEFLADTEQAYWTGIDRYLKDELKAKQVVSGTQINFSPSFVQAALDYVDHHSYWCHPSPVSKNWRIVNRPLVASNIGTIVGMMTQRVAGKPFTVSEYNHPFPNLYGAEGQPMLRAYGRFQGWDGVFEYTYNHNPNFEPDHNSYFFSIIARTDVLAHMPACAAIFLRGDVAEAKKTITVPADRDTCLDKLANGGGVSYSIAAVGLNSQLALIHKTEISLDGKGKVDESLNKLADQNVIISDTGELILNRKDPSAAYWLVNTANTKLFTGYPKGRTVAMGKVSLKVEDTKLGWATVSLVSKNATGFGEKGAATILLAATGYSGNKGMKMRAVTSKTLTLDSWGTGPVVNEGIPAVLLIPSNPAKTKCFALDEQGNRGQEVPVAKNKDGRSKITIDPKYRTVWYEIEVQ